jgi:hypothetical protein
LLMRMIDLMAPRRLPLIHLQASLEAHHIPYAPSKGSTTIPTTPRYTHAFPSETSRSPRVQTNTCFRDAFGRLAGRLGYNQAFPYTLGLKQKTNPQATKGASVPEQSFIVRLGTRGLRFQGARRTFMRAAETQHFGSPLAKICLAS